MRSFFKPSSSRINSKPSDMSVPAGQEAAVLLKVQEALKTGLPAPAVVDAIRTVRRSAHLPRGEAAMCPFEPQQS